MNHPVRALAAMIAPQLVNHAVNITVNIHVNHHVAIVVAEDVREVVKEDALSDAEVPAVRHASASIITTFPNEKAINICNKFLYLHYC